MQQRAALSIHAGRAIIVLIDVFSARKRRGDQTEGDGLTNTAVLFLQDNLRPRQHASLFSCIQFCSLLTGRGLLGSFPMFHQDSQLLLIAMALAWCAFASGLERISGLPQCFRE
jgi:hypothetical protein